MNTYEYGTNEMTEDIIYFMGSGDDTGSDDSNVTDIYGTDVETDVEFNPENMPEGFPEGFGNGRPQGGPGGFGERPDFPGGSDGDVTDGEGETDTDTI